jgi:hypothetical protein
VAPAAMPWRRNATSRLENFRSEQHSTEICHTSPQSLTTWVSCHHNRHMSSFQDHSAQNEVFPSARLVSLPWCPTKDMERDCARLATVNDQWRTAYHCSTGCIVHFALRRWYCRWPSILWQRLSFQLLCRAGVHY